MKNVVLREILETEVVRDSSGSEYKLGAHISPDVGEMLTSVIAAIRPKESVEVGMAYGVSSLFICEALRAVGATRHHAIDPNQSSEWKNIGKLNLERAGFADLLDLREQFSHEALPDLLAENVRVDFAFIDGWHVFDQTIVDFFYLDKMLNVGGVIAFDDCVWPSVGTVLRFILTNRRYNVFSQSKIRRESRKEKIAAAVHPLTSKLGMAPPNKLLGFSTGARCVAIQKIADDARSITDHVAF